MSESRADGRLLRSNAYEMFILVLTVLSLVIMVALWLPIPPATEQLLTTYDNIICFVFLVDFFMRLRVATSARHFFVHERGWLDLLGSIPTFGFFKFSGLFRLARISRLARITRLLRAQDKRQLIDDVVKNRSHYAGFITVFMAFLVIVVASVLVLTFESQASDANITTGTDALWWSIVTITTVGYGDYFPVTNGGRLTAFLVMFAGVGVIGSLASILSSVLVAPQKDSSAAQPSAAAATEGSSEGVERELAALRSEIAAVREMLAAGDGPIAGAS